MTPQEFKEKYSSEQRLSPIRKRDYMRAKQYVINKITQFINVTIDELEEIGLPETENEYKLDEEIRELLKEKIIQDMQKEIDKYNKRNIEKENVEDETEECE